MKKILSGLAMALVLPACVTINIYFPAAAAEKAAAQIIDDGWRLPDAAPAAKKEETAK